eukprot:13970693-Ditylum_brightwellii.AAC.1
MPEKTDSSLKRKRAQATILTFGPCLICALAFPNAFLPALEFSAIFRQVLFGVIPVLMVWNGRKKRLLAKNKDSMVDHEVGARGEASGFPEGFNKQELLPGGNIGLSLVATLTVLMLIVELNHVAHTLTSF